MKTKFDTGEEVLVPAKVTRISIVNEKIEYTVISINGFDDTNHQAEMRIAEENLVGLTDGSESIQEKLRDIVAWVNASSDHHLNIETNGKGKIIGAILEVRG